jgi:hypothetical protein
MRCPACDDDYEDHVRVCPDCGSELVPDDTPRTPPAAAVDARLGRFHPLMVGSVTSLLYRRGLSYVTEESADAVTVLVERAWRDDLRAELTLSWGDLVRRLDEETAATVLATGGSAPGWFDPPTGGHVDRAGRLVVDLADEDEDADSARMVGPALLALGAMLTLGGWYLIGSDAVTVVGLGLVVLGLFIPR